MFFAYFAAVLGPSLGFFFADWGLTLFGLTTHTPAGIAVAKFSQAFLTVIGVLAAAKLCGEPLASLYIRKGRLMLGLSVGFIAAVACYFSPYSNQLLGPSALRNSSRCFHGYCSS